MNRLVAELLKAAPSFDQLLLLLQHLSGRADGELRQEISQHLASRIAFLLLGDALGAQNYLTLEARIRNRLGSYLEVTEAITREVARTAACIESEDRQRKTSLRDLPYPVRQRLLNNQRNRCAICGWNFFSDVPSWRQLEECVPTLDHKDPVRLGGDRVDNLWVLCGLCNSLKDSRLHIGEHGRVWINNHVYYEAERPVGFWTIKRDVRCTLCAAPPQAARMRYRRRAGRGVWVTDNCETICERHDDGGVRDY